MVFQSPQYNKNNFLLNLLYLYDIIKEKGKGIKIMYEPTDDEIVCCMTGIRSCDFGICSECSLCKGGEEENDETEE